MTILDLTHLMHNDMPVYPGKRPVEIVSAATIGKDGYREKHLSIDGHTGTHIDAPAHMLEDGNTLDKYPISKFCGAALILSAREGHIDLDILELHEDEIKKADYVLFHTGWSKFWGSDSYLVSFPTLTTAAAEYLCQFSLKGVGIDAISVDTIDSTEFPIHHILFKSDMIIIENLKFPEKMAMGTGYLHVYPLHISKADGSPIRAVIFMDDSN